MLFNGFPKAWLFTFMYHLEIPLKNKQKVEPFPSKVIKNIKISFVRNPIILSVKDVFVPASVSIGFEKQPKY